MCIYFHVKAIPAEKKIEVFILFLKKTAKEWVQLKFDIFYNKNKNNINYFANTNNLINNFKYIYGVVNDCSLI